MRLRLFAYIVALLCLSLTFATSAPASERTDALARLAVSENRSEAASAITELREMGPEGLRILFDAYADEISRARAGLTVNEEAWQRLSAALDSVSQQRNSYASGLYWYTDFEKAKAAAKQSGKPILSLRLLGNLNDEFSCANSRFFRTVLYSNLDVSKYLREHFILHWKSVRPAPRVTIDFGDGRKLERTITGNSIHYVLYADGLLVDGLPGLYGPTAFMQELAQSEAVSRQVAGKNATDRQTILRAYHNARIQAITNDWVSDVAKAGGRVPEDVLDRIEKRKANPNAIFIAPVAITKMVTEVNILKAITADATALEAATDLTAWNKIADFHNADSRIDKGSIALITRQNQSVRDDAGLLARTVQNLEHYMALDTVRNEYMLHTKLHAWFVAGQAGTDVDSLNEKVYAELFQTPRTDPWLGLYSPDIYTGLDNGGVSKN
ncbi:MAG: hypothetical protein DMF68_12005 [Acidobacteria bacterium]|nr:MAG: hypothetical protein DMF68_12005 [Acidobacteriota bacterium]